MTKRRTYIYHSPVTGLIETIDADTGHILLIQKSTRDDLLDNKDATLPYQTVDHKTTRIERGQGLEHMGIILTKRWRYSDVLADLICQRVTEGASLLEICRNSKKAGEPVIPPYFILAKWRQDFPQFNEKLEQAFKDRSEIFHGKAIEQAELSDEDNASGQKVIVDTMKWGAAIDNPDRFGSKTKIGTEGEGNITFIINTGIRQELLPEKEAQPVIETEALKEIGDEIKK